MKIFQILFLIIFIVTTSTACAAAPKVSNSISKNVNAFNWKYFSQLDKTKNIFYSPYSIAAAFSIVANGATGQTQKEILAALDAKNIGDLNGNFENFRKYTKKNYDGDTILKKADLILINNDFIDKGINSKFKKIVEGVYQAEIDAADFSGNTDAVKSQIKNWVSENTDAFISNYEATIDSETVADILDVIYFNGAWENPFDTYKTWKSFFTNRNGKKNKVQMMSKTFENNIRYYADEKFMAVEIPYKNNLAAMCVILPVDENNLKVAESWNAEEISYRENFLANLKNVSRFHGKIEMFIPKFELDIKAALNENLQAMGIKAAFTDDAELGNIVKKMQLKISKATHQAKIKVDETGTEAAAVTEVTMVKSTAIAPSSKVVYFRADRPFLFVIRDLQTETDLFTGVVNELK